jgi:hypothetical protein
MIHMTPTCLFTRTELQLSMHDDLISFAAASPEMTIHGKTWQAPGRSDIYYS